MSALGRSMLRLLHGLPPDPADSEEVGRIFDATPLYGVDDPMTAKHRHNYAHAGYGGAGWSLYRCECGATEIDA